jgi:hypothetical protein
MKESNQRELAVQASDHSPRDASQTADAEVSEDTDLSRTDDAPLHVGEVITLFVSDVILVWSVWNGALNNLGMQLIFGAEIVLINLFSIPLHHQQIGSIGSGEKYYSGLRNLRRTLWCPIRMRQTLSSVCPTKKDQTSEINQCQKRRQQIPGGERAFGLPKNCHV